MVLTWKELNDAIIHCRACPRLVEHREAIAKNPPKRHQNETYWARPITGFGDRNARLLIVGLAPAMNGANRTGRIFTGDRSGDWLYRALFEAGFANQPTALHKNDGLRLINAYVTSTLRCAPPDNKPNPEEKDRCEPFLLTEFALLKKVTVVVALGQIGWQAYLRARKKMKQPLPKTMPKFGHGQAVLFDDGTWLLGSYHPSQQNTFTGKLTKEMFDAVFQKAASLILREPAILKKPVILSKAKDHKPAKRRTKNA